MEMFLFWALWPKLLVLLCLGNSACYSSCFTLLIIRSWCWLWIVLQNFNYLVQVFHARCLPQAYILGVKIQSEQLHSAISRRRLRCNTLFSHAKKFWEIFLWSPLEALYSGAWPCKCREKLCLWWQIEG